MRETPLHAWGDFHAHSRFARSIIPEEKEDYSDYSYSMVSGDATKLSIPLIFKIKSHW